MSDGTEKNIEDIKVGEKVIGLNGVNTVLKLARPKLRQRELLKLDNLTFSSEHCLWVRDPEDNEYWGTNDFNKYMEEKRHFTYDLNGQTMKYGFWKKDPYVITEEVEYLRVNGWWKGRPENLRKLHDPGIQLYQLITDGSHSMFADGFLVAAEARDDDYDYA